MSGVTPFQSSVGGALLGAASAAKLALTGRVLGISGTLRGALRGNTEPWRISFLTGLAGSSLLATHLYPVAFQPLSYSYGRAALSGLLVGFGSSVGNGCTSGHGICGNARLSLRSFVYTCVFMAAGIVTATLTKTAEALGVTRGDMVFPSAHFIQKTAIVALLSLSALLIPAVLSKQPKASDKGKMKRENGVLDCLTEFICGGVFGSALCLSGMTQAAKVAAFLSPFHPGFDPSLMFVMGAALLVATPATQFVLRYERTRMRTPVCTNRFQIPTQRQVDRKLLTGGLLFGMGWGLGGICPGPALVSLMQPSAKIAVYCVCLCLGFIADLLFGHRISAAPVQASIK